MLLKVLVHLFFKARIGGTFKPGWHPPLLHALGKRAGSAACSVMLAIIPNRAAGCSALERVTFVSH